MPSFDVVNNVDMQELSNAVNNANKELTQRWDFKGSNSEIELSGKTNQIVLRTEDEMKMRALGEILVTHAVRRKLDTDCMEFKAIEMAGGKTLRREVEIHQGIDHDIARQIVLFCASDSVTGQTLAIDSAASSTDAGSPCLGGEGLFPSEGPDGRQVLLLGKGRLE